MTRVIGTTGPGPVLDSLMQRGCSTVTLWPLNDGQRATLLDGIVKASGGSIDPRARKKILAAKPSSNGRYLSLLMSELDAIGVLNGSATIEPVISYLEADSVEVLFLIVSGKQSMTGHGCRYS